MIGKTCRTNKTNKRNKLFINIIGCCNRLCFLADQTRKHGYEHHSNQIYFTVDQHESIIYQCCYDPVCRVRTKQNPLHTIHKINSKTNAILFNGL